ncbi:MAG: tRNA (adenosine(37)-N6)-threonylcarbamoyltransferase complex ATPase subunit type 1 TsaE [Candidatus Kapabacteria bacterium]|nr:tRNA (adenosine(37)-N6)-threonylcarbamoyltransferase complex ATPase subunit type 1 TsaE [Candidatus Kapabacteria bacterium]
MEVITLRSLSEMETIQQGEQFASQLLHGDVVALEGDLGAGKTEFVKGICRFFAVGDLVTSPTFTIINQYDGAMPDGAPLKIYHVDLYRIDSPAELAEVGFDDMVFAHDAIKLIEWPEKAAHLMPAKKWTVSIQTDETNDEARVITVSSPQIHDLAT